MDINMRNKSGEKMKYDESARYFSYSDSDHDLWVFLTRTRYLVYRAREKELQRYGVSPEQMGVLFVVQNLGEKATPSEIARQIMRQPHTVSALIDRMAEKGFVKKAHDLDKRNLVRVSLTARGLKIYEYSKKRGPIHRIMSSITPAEQKKLREILGKLQVAARNELGMDRDTRPTSE